MSVRARLITATIVIIFLALVLGSFFALILRSANESFRQGSISSEIARQVFELKVATDEYLLGRGQEAKDKWFESYQAVGSLLTESYAFKNPEKEEVFGNLRQSHERIGGIFDRIVASDSSQSDEGLADSLNLELGKLIAGSLQLSKFSEDELTSVLKKSQIFIGAFVSGFILFSVISSVFLYKSIAAPLRRLRQGVEVIAGGNLYYKVGINSRDEIGQLSQAFDRMTAKLEASYRELETNVRQRTKELEAAKAKDEALLASIGDGFVATDKEGRVIYVNKSAETMLGWEASEIIGKVWSVDLPPITDEGGSKVAWDKRPVKIALSTGRKFTANHYYSHKNGLRFPVAITASPVVLNNEIVGAIVVFRDIIREKEIDKAKTEFVSLASHQLRTPLSITKWFAEILLSGDVGEFTPEQKKHLNEIYHSNERMIELVNALLNVSRLEMGTFVVEPEPTDFGKIAQSVIDELKLKIEEKKLTIDAYYDPDIPVINADPKLMSIVFQNIIGNAVKYTPEGGKIKVELKKIIGGSQIGERTVRKDSVLIKVSDTGYGIPDSAKGRIFSKLFRADNVKQKETEGTGLGLYIVRSIVIHSQGEIWFESQEGSGTTFYVTVPLSGMEKKLGTRKLT